LQDLFLNPKTVYFIDDSLPPPYKLFLKIKSGAEGTNSRTLKHNQHKLSTIFGHMNQFLMAFNFFFANAFRDVTAYHLLKQNTTPNIEKERALSTCRSLSSSQIEHDFLAQEPIFNSLLERGNIFLIPKLIS